MMISDVNHQRIKTNGIWMHIAEKGSGPLVLLLHGFPETWFAWRHQIEFLASHGYHVVAPDLRGYGDTDAPISPSSYTWFHIVGDLIGLLDHFAVQQAFVVGTDWGALAAWYLSLMRPDRVKGMIAMAVPFAPRSTAVKPLDSFNQMFGDGFYICQFQKAGRAERAFARYDCLTVMKKFMLMKSDLPIAPPGMEIVDYLETPSILPSWITEEEVQEFADKFQESGFTGGLNYYRAFDLNWELLAPWQGSKITVPAKLIVGDKDIGFESGGTREYIQGNIFKTLVPGRAARIYAGPAVVLSYAIAGLCALLSAFCYTEFAVDMPVAGGAFSYIRVTFGEFLAFLTGANLIIDYVLSNAAVARGFTAYLGTALGLSTHSQLRFTIDGLPEGYNEMDIIAVVVVLLLTLVICYSTRETSWLNITLTVLHILFIVFVIVVGFWRGEWKNFTEPQNPKNADGFFPFGASGVFNGAAMVYLSYIGYDAVSTMAEEVKNPVKDIPIGVSGSVILVTILYCLMAASMSALLPYDMIDAEAPFNGAFRGGSSRWRWVSNVIGVGASFGILTSMLVAMLGQARYMCVIGRSCVVPSWFARIHPSTSTPVNASAFLGIFTAAIALFTDLNILLNLVSIGTLFVFYMVANAVIYRRYVVHQTTNPWPTLSFLFSFSLTSIIFALLWQFAPSGKPKAFMLGSCIAVAIAILQLFHFMVPQARKPEFWGVPFMPWIPSISIFLNIFLLGSLDRPSYIRFGFFSALTVLVYVLYSVHSSFDAEKEGAIVSQKTGESFTESVDNAEDGPKV